MELKAFESPLEALAFNYVNFGIFSVVNNLWTWIAVATAAVSFWRIRAIGGVSANSAAVKPETISGFVSEASPVEYSPINGQPADAPSLEQATPVYAACIDGIAKGKKFTVHYDDAGDDDCGELTETLDDREMTEDYDWDITAVSGWWGKWEGVVRMRNGDEWYRHVDLTAINGNVVRLWDDGVRHRERGSLSPSVLADEWLTKAIF